MEMQEFRFPDEEEDKNKAGATASETTDELDIEIVDDTPEKDRGRKPLDKEVDEPTDEELENYSDKVKKRIKELTHARHDERRRAEAIERQAQELQQVAQRLLEENRTLKKTHNTTQQVFAETHLAKAEADLTAAKAKLKKAHEDFDTDAIVEAQAEVAQASYRLENAKSFKPTPLQVDEEVVQPRQAQQPVVDPDQKTLNWQAKNQWFGRRGNEAETSYALGLHQKLVNSGVDPRSDDYYEQITARMKSKFPELFEADDEEDEEQPKSGKAERKAPPVVAASAARSTAPGKVRLNQSQIAIARRLGLTPQQYAAEMLKLEREAQNG